MNNNYDIQISMDGKGRATDNIFIERLWRSLKYEYVYLNPSDDGLALYQGLSNWFRLAGVPGSTMTGSLPRITMEFKYTKSG